MTGTTAEAAGWPDVPGMDSKDAAKTWAPLPGIRDTKVCTSEGVKPSAAISAWALDAAAFSASEVGLWVMSFLRVLAWLRCLAIGF